MSWLLITILSYFIFAITALVDKYLLAGPIPSPKVYSFYAGALGILILLIAPFLGFSLPEPLDIVLGLLAGIYFTFSLFAYFSALSLFEASRVIPAIGGLLPIFTLTFTYLFSFGRESLNFFQISSLIFLIAGSILITLEKGKTINLEILQISALSAFIGALFFVLSKYVYLSQPFWSGFIWIRVGAFLAALSLLFFSKEVREELLKKRVAFKSGTAGIYILNQLFGSGANILQSFAVFLAPLSFVAMINALQGIQYVFLLIFSVFLSLKFPKILKEEISKRMLFQKAAAILLIGLGLIVLTLK